MASPMREKRAWSTRESDAESIETAAFEATVAAAKDTAARSGAFLSTAKEDLTDHRRWLQAQSVAVERDRARHERWLQRQREQHDALARKERTRRRRQLMRNRAGRAVQQAVWATALFFRSIVALFFAKIFAGIRFVGLLIARGVSAVFAGVRSIVLSDARSIAAAGRWTGAMILALARWIGRNVSTAATWSGRKARASARAGGAALSSGSALVAATAQSSARAGGAALSVGSAFVAAKAQSSARAGGSALAAGSSVVASRGGALVRSTGRSLRSGLVLVAENGSAFGAATGRSVSRGLAIAARQTVVLGAATGRSVSRGVAIASRQTVVLAAASKRQLAASYVWTRTKVQVLAPALYVRIARFGRQAERYARAAAASAKEALPARAAAPSGGIAPASFQDAGVEVYGPFPDGFRINGVSLNEPLAVAGKPFVAPPAETENAVSSWAQSSWARPSRAWPSWAWPSWTLPSWTLPSWTLPSWAQSWWARTRDVDLSQMMIIAGAVLLVCGGLLLGGGLILRAGAGTQHVAEEETGNGIAWTFEEFDRPLPERAVFTLSGTPASFRINGLAVSGFNLSDQPLLSVQGVLKPDVQRPALKLTLQVDKEAVAAGDGAAQSLEIVPEHTVPPHAPFRLVFQFPPEAMEDGEDGITVEEFFESYGGLVLNLTYEIDGDRKSLIQYLSPQMLRSQLDEVAAGS